MSQLTTRDQIKTGEPLSLAHLRRSSVTGELEPLYFTAGELASLLQVDDKTIYRWAQQEVSMPAVRIGGVVRFPRERVLRWFVDHEQGQSRPRRSRSVPADPHITSQRAESAKSSSTQAIA